MQITRVVEWPRNFLILVVAALSVLAALIHFWVVPEHFEEWWGYGVFFIVCAAVEGFYVVPLLHSPNRFVLLIGMIGNSAIVLLWLFTRTIGIPFFGPEAWDVEGVGVIDVCATLSEAAIVISLGALLLSHMKRDRASIFALFLAGGLLLTAHLPHLMLFLRLI